MASENAIMGDDATNYGTDIDVPEYQVERELALAEAKSKASFSKTREFKELKAKLESRIEYYKTQQPGGLGQPLALIDMSNSERGWRVLASDLIIKEFQAVIAGYELSYQTVQKAEAEREAARQKRA